MHFVCFLVLNTPGIVVIIPVAAAPVPAAVERIDKEKYGLLLLVFFCSSAAAAWLCPNGKRTAIMIHNRETIAVMTIKLLVLLLPRLSLSA
jgi:hypothetical protein